MLQQVARLLQVVLLLRTTSSLDDAFVLLRSDSKWMSPTTGSTMRYDGLVRVERFFALLPRAARDLIVLLLLISKQDHVVSLFLDLFRLLVVSMWTFKRGSH